MMRKLIPVLFVLIAVAAVACGGDDEEEAGATVEPTASPVVLAAPAGAGATTGPTSTPPPAPSIPSAAAPSQQAAAAPAGDKPQGGIFRRLWSDPPTLDPHLTSDTTSAFLVVEIHAGLVALSPDLQLVPDIAERWERSADGLVYTFYLRPYARFHDGKPITAQDFKWSLERAARPETGSPVADTYLNDIVGAKAVFDGDTTDLSGVKVIDDHTLQITIDAPKAYFLAKMTYPTAYVLDRENVESGGRNWFDSPNGAGPFRLKEYRIGERIVLERNDLYHRE
ncbi:MAG: hypothetical protein IH956_07170, partial [Chloroflexi bacterium]|nr:hypothetical protein [Chloroflexota bacterium]